MILLPPKLHNQFRELADAHDRVEFTEDLYGVDQPMHLSKGLPLILFH
jgi:hypothetical protein